LKDRSIGAFLTATQLTMSPNQPSPTILPDHTTKAITAELHRRLNSVKYASARKEQHGKLMQKQKRKAKNRRKGKQ
jgi:hypothetical protein